MFILCCCATNLLDRIEFLKVESNFYNIVGFHKSFCSRFYGSFSKVKTKSAFVIKLDKLILVIQV